MLTIEKLKAMEPFTIFASGTIEDNPDGLHMTGSGKLLVWVAKRGQIHDWCIYTHWAENGKAYAASNGDKVYSTEHIKKLVPCDDEAFAMYRH